MHQISITLRSVIAGTVLSWKYFYKPLKQTQEKRKTAFSEHKIGPLYEDLMIMQDFSPRGHKSSTSFKTKTRINTGRKSVISTTNFPPCGTATDVNTMRPFTAPSKVNQVSVQQTSFHLAVIQISIQLSHLQLHLR